MSSRFVYPPFVKSFLCVVLHSPSWLQASVAPTASAEHAPRFPIELGHHCVAPVAQFTREFQILLCCGLVAPFSPLQQSNIFCSESDKHIHIFSIQFLKTIIGFSAKGYVEGSRFQCENVIVECMKISSIKISTYQPLILWHLIVGRE